MENIEPRQYQKLFSYWESIVYHENSDIDDVIMERTSEFNEAFTIFKSILRANNSLGILRDVRLLNKAWVKFVKARAKNLVLEKSSRYDLGNQDLYIKDPVARQFIDINLIEDEVNHMSEDEVNEEITTAIFVLYVGDFDLFMKRQLLRLIKYFKYRRQTFNNCVESSINDFGVNILFSGLELEDEFGILFEGVEEAQNLLPSRSEILQIYLNRFPFFKGDEGMNIEYKGRKTLNFGVRHFETWLFGARQLLSDVRGRNLYEMMKKFDPFTIMYCLRRSFLILKTQYPEQFNRMNWEQLITNENNRRSPFRELKINIFSIVFILLLLITQFMSSGYDAVYNILKQVDYHHYVKMQIPPAITRNTRQVYFNHTFLHIFPYIVGSIDIDDGGELGVNQAVNDVLKVYLQKIKRVARGNIKFCSVDMTFRGVFDDEHHPIRNFRAQVNLDYSDITEGERNISHIWDLIRKRVDDISESALESEKYEETIALEDYTLTKLSFFVDTKNSNDLNGDFSGVSNDANLISFCRGVPGVLAPFMIRNHVTNQICLYEAYYHIIHYEKLKKKTGIWKNKIDEELKNDIYNSFHQESKEVMDMVLGGKTVELTEHWRSQGNPDLDVNLLIWERKDKSLFGSRLDQIPEGFIFELRRKFTLITKEAHCYAVLTSDIFHYLIKEGYVTANKDNYLANEEKFYEKRKELLVPYVLESKKPYSEEDEEGVKREHWAYDFETFPGVINEDQRRNGKESKHVIYLIYCINIDKMDNPGPNDVMVWKGIGCEKEFLNWIKSKVCVDEINQRGRKKKKDKKEIIMWSFNGHKFDLVFLIEDIIAEYPKVNLIGRPTDIKQLSFMNFKFYDFYKIFPMGSLKEQGEAWKVEVKKGDFDHKKMNINTFNDHMEEACRYCHDDCRVLGGLVKAFMNFCHNELKISCFQSSCSSLSMTYFRTNFLDDIEMNGLPWEEYIGFKEGYFGGVTSRFKKKSDKDILYYYDINSSYPATMVDFAMPHEFIDNSYESITLNDLVEQDGGPPVRELYDHYYYYVKEFKFKDNILYPFFPEKDTKGQLYYRLSSKKICGRWGHELKFALPFLEKLEIVKFAKFSLLPNDQKIFSGYIKDVYNKRLEAKASNNSIMELVMKLCMNNTYGKMGQKLYPTTLYVNKEQLTYLVSTCNSMSDVGERRVIKNIEALGEKIFAVELDERRYGISSLIHQASFITSRSRMRLMKAIYDLTEKGTVLNVLYCDTDSIITEIPLDESFICSNTLGKWKLENIIINNREALLDMRNDLKCFIPDIGFLVNGAKFYFMFSVEEMSRPVDAVKNPKDKGRFNIGVGSKMYELIKNKYHDFRPDKYYNFKIVAKIKGISKKTINGVNGENLEKTYNLFKEYMDENKSISFTLDQFIKDIKNPGLIYNAKLLKRLNPNDNSKRIFNGDLSKPYP